MPATARSLRTFDVPTFTTETAHMVKGVSGTVTIPVPYFLVEHEQGLVLFDTGIRSEAFDDMAATYGDAIAGSANMTGHAGQRIDRQLETAGYSVQDVTHVVVSHLHFDHAGGLGYFPHAQIYGGAGERDHACTHHHVDIAFREDDAKLATELPHWNDVPLHEDVDLFGDGSIVILSTPGHSIGHLSLLVRLESGPFVLTGDAAHLRVSLERELPGPADHDQDEAVRSIQRIKSLAEEVGGKVWVSHDPEDWTTHGPGPITLS